MSMRLLPFALAALATSAAAQVAPGPAATPTPSATIPPEASAVPPPLSVTLPTPVAAPTPSVRPAPAATVPVSRPTPRAEPSPRPEVTPTPRLDPTPTPSATPTSRATPTPAEPAPSPSATAVSPPPVLAGAQPAEALPIPPQRGSAWSLPTVGGLLVAVALVALVVRRRRRRGDPVPDAVEPVVGPDPALRPTPVAAPSSAPARAWLAIEVRPRRAGVNLLTATLDTEVVVRNEGEAPAQDVRVALHLLSARAGQEAELAQVFEAAGRPITAPFALEPGEERVSSGIATLPRGEIAMLTAGDRPMFVPLAAVSVRYRSGDIEGVTAGAFAIGIEREGATKLAPFRLDQPSQMHDRVGVRPHAPAIRR